MDSSGLSGTMKGAAGCVVGYEFTRFASAIIQRVIFNGEEDEVLGVLTLARTRVLRKLRWRREEVDL